jgi:hypothetical protein
MTAVGIPADPKQLAALVQEGEGGALELKRSTGELKEGMQSLCAFLNGSGGMVLFGVRPSGAVEGQEISDQTLRDIAQAADRFEPPAHVSIHRIKVKAGREVVVAAVESGVDLRPCTYEGRPYERVGSTTRRMPQAKYERLLVERGHAKRRWENLPAEGLALKDLDRRKSCGRANWPFSRTGSRRTPTATSGRFSTGWDCGCRASSRRPPMCSTERDSCRTTPNVFSRWGDSGAPKSPARSWTTGKST